MAETQLNENAKRRLFLAVDIVAEFGIDHERIANVPLFKTATQEFVNLRMSASDFRRCVRNIGIFNGWCS